MISWSFQASSFCGRSSVFRHRFPFPSGNEISCCFEILRATGQSLTDAGDLTLPMLVLRLKRSPRFLFFRLSARAPPFRSARPAHGQRSLTLPAATSLFSNLRWFIRASELLLSRSDLWQPRGRTGPIPARPPPCRVLRHSCFLFHTTLPAFLKLAFPPRAS